MLRRSAVLATTLAVLAGAAGAAEVSGTVTASLAGEVRQWVSLESVGGGEGGEAATSNFHEFGEAITMISLVARSGVDGPLMADVIVIEFALAGTGDSLSDTVSYAIVSYFPDGLFPHYIDDAPSVAIVSVALDGDALALRGRFAATLSRLDSLTEPRNTTDQMAIEGDFDVRALRAVIE